MHKSLIEWRGTDQHPLHPEKPVLLSEGERNVGKKRNKKCRMASYLRTLKFILQATRRH